MGVRERLAAAAAKAMPALSKLTAEQFAKLEPQQVGMFLVHRVDSMFAGINNALDKTALPDMDIEVTARLAIAKMQIEQAKLFFKFRGLTEDEWKSIDHRTDVLSTTALAQHLGVGKDKVDQDGQAGN